MAENDDIQDMNGALHCDSSLSEKNCSPVLKAYSHTQKMDIKIDIKISSADISFFFFTVLAFSGQYD